MNLLSAAHNTAALAALAPILDNGIYWGGRPIAHDGVAPLPIDDALVEIEMQLTPIGGERLHQIISRLMLHYPLPPHTDARRIFQDYSDRLRAYPEDLLCAAYHHILRHHQGSAFPAADDFIAFMDPEFVHRLTTRRKIALLAECIEGDQ